MHQPRMRETADLPQQDVSWRRSPFLYSVAIRMTRRSPVLSQQDRELRLARLELATEAEALR